MDLIISFLQRTIGQKILVGLTGLGLCLFVFIHMIGNLLILSGPEAYNSYAHKIHEFPLFILLELALLCFFLGHIVLSFLRVIQNKRAKGIIGLPAKGIKKLSFAHKALWLQGVVLVLFLFLHLLSFKFGVYYETLLKGEKVRDIYRLAVENFQKPHYVIGYSFVLCLLFTHLLRGLPASLKSLGLSHPVYLSFMEKLAWLFSLMVAFGFLIPIWYIFLYL